MRVESRARRVAKVHAYFAACRLSSLRPAFRRYLLQQSGESATRMNRTATRRYALRLHSEKQKNRRNECSYRFQFSQVPNLGLSPCVGDVRSCVLRLILRELQSWSCQ